MIRTDERGPPDPGNERGAQGGDQGAPLRESSRGHDTESIPHLTAYDRACAAIEAALSRDEVTEALEAGQITVDQALALYTVQANNREPEQQCIDIRLRGERYLRKQLRAGKVQS